MEIFNFPFLMSMSGFGNKVILASEHQRKCRLLKKKRNSHNDKHQFIGIHNNAKYLPTE